MKPKSLPERLVVIGGCAAGMSAASKAKRLNPNLDVLALERTAHVSYSACGIPYYVADLVRDAADLITITPEQFREQRGIDVLTTHQVVAISPVKRKITAVDLASGNEREFDYDRLLISVGGIPKRPAIPGMRLLNVHTIQTLQDGIDLRKFVDERKPERAVIIGGGYLAMEMAESLRNRFLDVTVVEKKNQILPDFESQIAEKVAEELRKHEISVKISTTITQLEGNASGEVIAVTMRDKTEKLPADLVLVCVGLTPNIKLASMAGVRLGSTRAIATDWKMQTNVPNIYAAGDCVQVKNLVSGKPDYIPLGPTANKQGRVAGENIGGGTASFSGVVGTSVFKAFDLEVAKTGLGFKAAQSQGFAADSVTITANSKAGYYPGDRPLTISVIFEKRTRKLLGAQMVGSEGVSKRIDIFAVALTNKMTLNEMAYLDLSYAPPFAPVWDPLLVAINVAKGKR